MSTLPEDKLVLTYLAEGNANVVYAVKGSQLVLRLRKDLPFLKPTSEAFSAFKERIRPLFIPGHEDLLIDQTLFKLDEVVLHHAQSILKQLERDDNSEPKRPQNRRNVYLPTVQDESYGILMPNLTGSGGFKLVEFKPKWLLQSPSAPANAMRCRTCAWNHLRRQKRADRGRGDSGLCPLQLLADDPLAILNAVAGLDPVATKPSFISSFVLKVQPVLRHLQSLQLKHNEVGLSDFEDRSGKKDFALAMGLRDCSIFLIVDATSTERPEIAQVKVADLELKNPAGGKQDQWASIERSLLDSGAYLSPDNVCTLSPRNRQT